MLKYTRNASRTSKAYQPTRPLEEVHVAARKFAIKKTQFSMSTSVSALVAVCAATGAVAAINVSDEDHNLQGYADLVEQMLKPKGHLDLWNPESAAKWPVYGIPETIIFDDPLCVLEGVSGCLMAMGCTPYYMPNKYGANKADRVLRLFDNATAKASSAETDIHSFTDREEVRQFLHHFIIEFYHNYPFFDAVAMKAETPMETWTRGVLQHGVRMTVEAN